MSTSEREFLIEWLSLKNGAYGREHCEKLTDEELERIFNLNVPQRDE